LPSKDRRRLLAVCEPVELACSEVLAKPGDRMRHAYFPIGSFVSLIMPPVGHPDMAVGMVGDEGMLGINLALGVDVPRIGAVVQGAGSALRVQAAALRRELDQSLALQRVLRRFAHVFIGQIAQTVACTRFHVVEARLARWLLTTQDRAHSGEFHVTHESLANVLGVRRVGITRAASSLQQRQLIRYHRGAVTVVDRPGLQAASCACYEADRAAYRRTME
jgi:hypothetical protein